MSSSRPNLLSISSWNVNSLSQNFFLGDKLSNYDFLGHFNHSDIIVLTETWKTADFSLSSYELFTSPAKKNITIRTSR